MRTAAAHTAAGAFAPDGKGADGVPAPGAEETATLPIVQEQVEVAKRVVEVGRVRVSVETDVDYVQVHEALHGRRVEVERRPLGHVLAEGEPPPRTREEGDTLIVPIVEEQAVVVKRLVVREELRLRFIPTETPFNEEVAVRRQRAIVERTAIEPEPSAEPHPAARAPQ
jgi:stress response protein YsnF